MFERTCSGHFLQADVMQFELLARSACLTAVFGAQQRVAANDGTEFSAHAWLARNWQLSRLGATLQLYGWNLA